MCRSMIKPGCSFNYILVFALAITVTACSDSGEFKQPQASTDPRLAHAVLLDSIPTTTRTDLQIIDSENSNAKSILSIELARQPERV